MKIAYLCANCGALHAAEQIDLWGTTAESNGQGPRAVCTQLLKDSFGSGYVCRGSLVAQEVANDEDTLPVTPL